MSMIPINLDNLKREDACSVATALLYSLRGTPQYSVISELFYILDYDNFIRFIRYFGGMEIRVPSSEELLDNMRSLLLYQYRIIDELEWSEALSKAGYSESESSSAKMKLNHLIKLLESQEVGGREYN